MKDVPPLSEKAQTFKLGRYQHYKGGYYEAFAIGRDSETLVEKVYYKMLKDGTNWDRKLEEFMEDVEVEDKKVPRFRKI